jgi:hypothetical protein
MTNDDEINYSRLPAARWKAALNAAADALQPGETIEVVAADPLYDTPLDENDLNGCVFFFQLKRRCGMMLIEFSPDPEAQFDQTTGAQIPTACLVDDPVTYVETWLDRHPKHMVYYIDFKLNKPKPDDSSDGVYLVERIVDRRRRRNITEYLVQWQGYPADESTWEPAANLKTAGTAVQKMVRDFKPAEMNAA